MKVQLIDYTGKGNPNKRYAAELLAFTKSTRMEMSPCLMQTISEWDDVTLDAELLYMSQTIPSSWEFCDYTFLISDCTRAFTHQLVRNRHGSYAQQTMRILDVSGFGYEVGPSINKNQEALELYCDHMAMTDAIYNDLNSMKGVKIEDARGVLPTNIHTNIIAKFNLRTLSEIVQKRSSSRTQGEYRDYLEKLYQCVIEVHPWAELFLRNRKGIAAEILEDFVLQMKNNICEGITDDQATNLIKQIDILRG